MLPLSKINELVGSVDADRSSPVADAVAAAWGHAPGAARFVRSSATHVFAVGAVAVGAVAVGADDAVAADGPCAYLRFAPATHRGPMTGVAALMRQLSDDGLPVVAPIPSNDGDLVTIVPTPLGAMHAMAVAPAAGSVIDAGDLTERRARTWGAALATVHHGHSVSPASLATLPARFDQLTPAAERCFDPARRPAGDPAGDSFAGDPPLSAAVRELTGRLAALPRHPGSFGLVHGDFELDNLAWHGDTVTAFDFDDAARSWFVADIAKAVIDLAPVPARTPRPGEAPLFAAFLAGYRDVGPLDDADLAHLPLFTALNAAVTLARLSTALDAGTSAADPGWLVRLRERLDEHAQQLRTDVLAVTADTR